MLTELTLANGYHVLDDSGNVAFHPVPGTEPETLDGTYRADGFGVLHPWSYASGYQLGLGVGEFGLTRTQAMRQICTLASRYPGCDIGGWTNPSNGLYDVEVSTRIEGFTAARFLGVKLSQIALWDWANKTEVIL